MPRQAAAKQTFVGQIVQVKDLTAGVNLRPSPTNVNPDQSALLLNTLIASKGELGIYPGWKAFSASSIATRRSQGGKRIYLKNSVTFSIAADNGNIYSPNDATGAFGSTISTGWNSSNPIDFPNDRDQVAIFDGATVPQKSLDGVTWTQLGITAPAAPAVVAASGGSLVSGDTYEVTCTYYNNVLLQESNESLVSTVVPSGGNLTINVTRVASADAQVGNILIYARDLTAGEATRRLVTTAANTNGTTAITSDNWSNGHPPPAIGLASVALAMSFGVIWKNRWWGRDAVVKNRIRFSQVFANNQWPDNFFVDIPFERGEDILGMIPLGDVLVVFGYTRFYLILGQTSLDFEVRPALGAQTGCFGFRAVDVMENSIVHGGAPGVYVYNGATDTLLTFPIDPAWQYMMGATTATELAVLPITYHKLRKELRVAVPNVFPLGIRGEWILDLNRTNVPVPPTQVPNSQAWFATDRTIGGYIQWDGNEPNSSNQGRIFSWSPTVVQWFEERTGTSANGSDLTMQYFGYMLPFGIQFGRVIDTYLEYQPSGSQTTFAADLSIDGNLQGSQSLNIAGMSTSKYGMGVYGVSKYGGGVNRAMLPIIWPLTAEGHAAQLRVTYVGQGIPKLFTYGHNVIEEDLPRGF